MENILYRLSMSKFRSSFKLKEKDKKYVNEKGIETIKNHAYDFINNRFEINKIFKVTAGTVTGEN